MIGENMPDAGFVMRRIRTSGIGVVFVIFAFGATAKPVLADEGRCLIVVKGHTYLKGNCNVSVESGGSFKVGVGEKSRSEYFAYIELGAEPRKARGYWNGVDGDDHAHEELGSLNRRGACWSNSNAKVCAWLRD
jgi:hypothetical protein